MDGRRPGCSLFEATWQGWVFVLLGAAESHGCFRKGFSVLRDASGIALWSGVVERFGHAGATGRDGCLACVRRCLPT